MWFIIGWVFILALCAISFALGVAKGRRDQPDVFPENEWDAESLSEISGEHDIVWRAK